MFCFETENVKFALFDIKVYEDEINRAIPIIPL